MAFYPFRQQIHSLLITFCQKIGDQNITFGWCGALLGGWGGGGGYGDLAFDLLGYTYVFTNNFSTAAKALLTKSLLRDQGFSSLELLYYNSGLMIPALLVIVVFQTDFFQILHYPTWTEPLFLFCFMFSCCSAVLLNFSLIQCTHYTSALTTSIIGVMKVIFPQHYAFNKRYCRNIQTRLPNKTAGFQLTLTPIPLPN
ncbi:unnamed protein product [Echinostoma caproni]|uniref:PhoLip_ATPase_C domain-containing protein n=1 Tax=Echinostoma caproni TaxID=27848 RepID=A0A183AB56_9TREM|nr:unnamed protein product [Echinostoma caproni]